MQSASSRKVTVQDFKAWLEDKDEDAIVMLKTAPLTYRELETSMLALKFYPGMT